MHDQNHIKLILLYNGKRNLSQCSLGRILRMITYCRDEWSNIVTRPCSFIAYYSKFPVIAKDFSWGCV